VLKDALWNDAKTDRVGTDWVECTLDFGTVLICDAVFRLSGRGTLAIYHRWPTFGGRVRGPHHGGRADFQHVTGQVQVTFRDDTEEVATLTFGLSGMTP
jgi:hypothetical protein